MTRNYLWCAVLTALSLVSTALAARIERGGLIYDNIPEAVAEPGGKLDDYLAGREAISLGWSPKGELLISTRFGDVAQLHVLDKPGGDRRQITFGHEPVIVAAYSPDPGRSALVYATDANGNENYQLYYQRSGDPMARLLTDGRSMNGGAIWSNAGRQVAFFSTARDGLSFDIDVVEPDSANLPRLAVTGDATMWRPLDWSPDDRKLLLLKSPSRSESYLYVVDLATGQKREVDPVAARVNITGARFSRDGQGVYYLSDRDADFARLRYANLFTGEKSVLSAAIPADVTEFALSRDGRYVGYVSNEGGADKLSVVDLRSHQDLTPPRLPGAGLIDHLSFDAEGRRLAFTYGTTTLPRDAYVLDLAGNRVEAWTHSESGPVDTSKFAAPRLAQVPTFDRPDGRVRMLPVYVYEPNKPGPHPVLLLLSDSSVQFRPGHDPWLQFLVTELGYAVVAPNIRGADGYGKAFAALANGTQRDDAVKDVGAIIVWLGTQSAMDAKHVVVTGGYLALAALVNYGDRLIGGVDFAGVSDFISYLTDITPVRQNWERAEYGDERVADMRAYLRRISPLTNADHIARPLLVVHGKNDQRTPSSESDQLVNRLRSRGGVVWYLEAKDEGHGFARKPDRDACYQVVAQFLKTLH